MIILIINCFYWVTAVSFLSAGLLESYLLPKHRDKVVIVIFLICVPVTIFLARSENTKLAEQFYSIKKYAASYDAQSSEIITQRDMGINLIRVSYIEGVGDLEVVWRFLKSYVNSCAADYYKAKIIITN
jgi:hypothetical protein